MAPVELERPASDEALAPDVPWVTIVWNDPVNLMSYVTYVFQTYFGYDTSKAEKLMLDVHEKGRAVVSNGAARRWSATPRPCTSTASGRRSARTTETPIRPTSHPAETGTTQLMGEPFRTTRRGLEIRLSEEERDLLANLFGQLDELLDDGLPVGDEPFDELAGLSGLNG